MFLHDVQLVHVGLAGEERLAVDELAHDAPDGPLIHLESVRVGSEQQLGRAVPPRGDVIRQGLARRLGAGERAGETEVAQFERGVRSGLGVDQEVLGFDVAVDDVRTVAPRDGADELQM